MYFKKQSEISDAVIEELKVANHHLLIFVGEKSAADVLPLIRILNSNNLKFFGGIYPTIIQDTSNYDDGILILQIPNVDRILTYSFDNPSEFREIKDLEEINTAIILIDAMINETDALLRKIYGLLNNKINIIGGGGGFMTLEAQPCIFTNSGFIENGAAVALLKNKSKIGVKHGWEVFAGPFIATSIEKNVIKELNWRPAFEVYREVIESNSNNQFDENNFLDIAKIFPFGIFKEGAEYIVRDPISVNKNGEIVCISEVPENATLQILTGDPEKLISAAREVAVETLNEKADSNCLMVFDCITRVMYLDDQFVAELEAMKNVYTDRDCKIRGVSTLGEIASSGMGFVEFYNKTIVASTLYK